MQLTQTTLRRLARLAVRQLEANPKLNNLPFEERMEELEEIYRGLVEEVEWRKEVRSYELSEEVS